MSPAAQAPDTSGPGTAISESLTGASHGANTVTMSVNLMPRAPVEQIVELAVFAEKLGCRRVWVYDEGLSGRDVYVTLAAIAAATERVLIGPGVTNPYVRHPAATAAAIATLDEFSGGRAFLGLGAGGGVTLGPMTIERHAPISTVTETVACIRALFAAHMIDFDGEHVCLRNAKLSYGRANIEIILAGRGPRMVDLAARVADGFYLSYVHKDTIATTVADLRRNTATMNVVYSTTTVLNERDLESARADLSFRLLDSPPEIRDRIGFTNADEQAIRKALAYGGPTAAARHVKVDWVHHFAIIGESATVKVELRSLLADNGIDEFQLAVSDIQRAPELMERTASLLGRT